MYGTYATISMLRTGGGDRFILEPISKSSEEDNEAGELDKTEEVLGVVLPADKDATLPLYPGEEPLDEPTNVASMKHSSSSKLVGNIRQNSTQNLVAAPSLKSADAQFCSSDSFAAACAIAHLC
jgi:hypothetical protein